ncbi:hypothetical protein FACS1894162_5080 [Bacteroidia bacterium]|nr:hypothetical protein FACS1894162_5080 [Bacteroidia bacterium]
MTVIVETNSQLVTIVMSIMEKLNLLTMSTNKVASVNVVQKFSDLFEGRKLSDAGAEALHSHVKESRETEW